jgi:hypothetical protein
MKKKSQTLLLVSSTLLLLVSVTVSAQRQPPTGSPQDRLRGTSPVFTGTWNTVTGKGKKLVISLRHDRSNSNIVTGSYTPINGLTASYRPSDSSITGFVKVSWRAEPVLQNLGSISGRVTDNVLRFTWSQDDGHGAGRFTLSSDGESFEGTYSATNNPDDTSGGTLNGTRAPNFAGAWRANLGEQSFVLILQQDGNRVTGEWRVNSGPPFRVFREGIVDGNTVRFKVMGHSNASLSKGLNLFDQYEGVGELVMDKGGKSFKGTLVGAATSGTLLGR